jgi:hypothetical protein
MPELSLRIRRVTDDLQVIQSELSHAAEHGASPEERERVMREIDDLKMLNDLKAAVDHMRHLLWSYIEASSKKGADVERTLQAVRMQRVTEMLKILAPTVDEEQPMQAPEAQSFLDMVQLIAHKTVDRHRAQGA